MKDLRYYEEIPVNMKGSGLKDDGEFCITVSVSSGIHISLDIGVDGAYMNLTTEQLDDLINAFKECKKEPSVVYKLFDENIVLWKEKDNYVLRFVDDYYWVAELPVKKFNYILSSLKKARKSVR
mgnify:CR=1 FL=1